MKSGACEAAERLLKRADTTDLAMADARSLERHQKAAADACFRSVAGTRALLGDPALSRLDYGAATERFAGAAELVPEGHDEERSHIPSATLMLVALMVSRRARILH
jgi:hypothetical protein